MATQGPLQPSTASGTSWTSPTSIEGNSTFATWAVPAGNDDFTNALIGSNLGFSIPSGATINGISVTLARKSSTGMTSNTSSIILRKAGSIVGTAKGPGSTWSSAVTDETWGTSSDLWGTTWTYSDVNNSGFGVSIGCEGNNGTGFTKSLSVQYYRITVTYTAAAASVTSCQTSTFGF